MPDWLIWFIAFWVIVGCGSGCRRLWGRRRLAGGTEPGATGELSAGGAGHEAQGSVGKDPQSISAQAAAPASSTSPDPADTGMHTDDTVLGALQRRFVEGNISLEQYEAELDRLDRKELT